MSARLHAHYWTIRPHLMEMLGRRRSRQSMATTAWSTRVEDPRIGAVDLSGEWTQAPGGADASVIVLHGLGGDPRSSYCLAAVRGFAARGFDVLNLAMRGADLRGEDVYHGGLWGDLAAAVDAVARNTGRPVYVCGFSVGGHVGLRLATETDDPRIRPDAVVAICPPVDLATARVFIDEYGSVFYRNRVVAGLRAGFRSLRPERGIELARPIERARTIRGWDEAIVVPRFGFASPEDYYATESVAPRLRDRGRGGLQVRSLVVIAEHDPIVPAHVIGPAVDGASGLEVRWSEDGGHLGFPADLDLRLGPDRGLCGQLATWFRRGG